MRRISGHPSREVIYGNAGMSNGMRLIAIARGLAWALSCGVVLAFARPVQAQNQVLTWDAPEGCPEREEVLAKVREIAGDEVFAKTTLHASGRIRQVDGEFRLELEVEGEAGAHERTINAKVCRDLLGASAVVLGLNLRRLADASEGSADDGAANDEGTTGVANEATATTTSPADSGSTPASTPAVEKRPPARPSPVDDSRTNDTPGVTNMWLALPQVQLSIGALPDPSLHWAAGFGYRTPDWRVSLTGRYQPGQFVTSDVAPNVGATVSRVALELQLARAFRYGSLEWAPGVTVSADYLMAQGEGEDIVASTATVAYPVVGVGVSLRWFVASWFSLAVNVGGEVPLARPTLTVDALGNVGQMGQVSGRLSLGLEWNF